MNNSGDGKQHDMPSQPVFSKRLKEGRMIFRTKIPNGEVIEQLRMEMADEAQSLVTRCNREKASVEKAKRQRTG